MGDWVGLKQPRICYTTGNASTSLFKHPACSSQGYHAVNTPVHPFLVHIPILNGWNSPHVSWFPAQQIFPWAKLQSDAGDRLLCLTNVPQLEVGHGAWRSLWESKKRRHPRHGGKMWKIGPWNSWYGQLKITLRLECVLCSDSIKNWTIEMGISTIKWCTPSSKIFPNSREKKQFTSILWNHWNPIGIPLESHWNPIGPAEAQQGSGGPIQGAQHALPGGHQEVPRMPFWGRDNMVYMQEITGRSLGKRDV